jgi:hypothetical protein
MLRFCQPQKAVVATNAKALGASSVCHVTFVAGFGGDSAEILGLIQFIIKDFRLFELLEFRVHTYSMEASVEIQGRRVRITNGNFIIMIKMTWRTRRAS